MLFFCIFFGLAEMTLFVRSTSVTGLNAQFLSLFFVCLAALFQGFFLTLFLVMFIGKAVRICGVDAGRVGPQGGRRRRWAADPAESGADSADPGHGQRARAPASAAHHCHGE